MAIIHSSIKDALERKRQEGHSAFQEYFHVLASVHGPKDYTKEKENLLSLYINLRGDPKDVEQFVTQEYTLQHDKLDNQTLDKFIEYFINNNQHETLYKLINKKPNLGYSSILLPTKFKLELLEHTYQDNDKYVDKKFNIVDNLFNTLQLNFKTIKEWQQYVETIYNCLEFLVRKGKIKFTELSTLNSDSNIEQYNLIIRDYPRSLEEEKNIRAILQGTLGMINRQTLTDPIQNNFNNAVVTLSQWRKHLEKLYLDIHLTQEQKTNKSLNKI